MNTIGDDEDFPVRPVPGQPLSAPVAAELLPDRLAGSYPEHPAEPARRSPGFQAHVPQHAVPDQAVPGPRDPDSAPPDEPPPSGRAAHAAAAGRGGHDFVPESPSPASYFITGSSPDEPPEDPTRVILRKHLDALRIRAANASSWLETSVHYARLINRDGVVPVTARFTRDDIEFLGRAREEVLGFAEFGLRLLELHAPLDAGGISTDPSSPILRCRSCMWRWPCPTFRMLTDALSQLPRPNTPSAR